MPVSRRNGVALVLFLLGVAVLISAAGLALLKVSVGGQAAVARNSTLDMRLATDLHEPAPVDAVQQIIAGEPPMTLRAVVETLRKAKVDRRIGAVLIRPTGLNVALWGKVQEVRDAILDYRTSGKPAIAFLEYGTDREYFLATACDKIFLVPTSTLDLDGLASYSLFLRGTLDKIEAYPDFLRIGAYKTAPNQYTEKGFTPEHREVTEAITGDLFEQLVAGIAKGRKKTADEVRALVDQGPFLAADALRAGLVDDLAYADQIDDRMKVPGGKLRTLSMGDYSKVSMAALGLGRGPRIAVLYAVGIIVSGESGYDVMNGPVLGSDTFIEHLRQIRRDPSVKAIVVRVDSPGGSAVASDAMWRELVLTRDEKKDRPLVVSMSDLAASGGYYISMAAPWIVAQPGTLTGSIGIYTGKFVTGGTYGKIGATIEAVSRGRHAELQSPARPFNDAERAKMQAYIQSFYTQFVEKAAASRKMTPEKLDGVARGRVWTGQQAREVGLVDELGGLDRAVAAAKARAKIPAASDVELVVYPPRRSVYELISRGFRSDQRSELVSWLLPDRDRRALGWLSAPLRLFRSGEPLALMPVLLQD